MRTTLTLEPELAAELRLRAQRDGISWKQVVNDAIRLGLAAGPAQGPQAPYRTPIHDPGPVALPGVHSVHDLLVYGEGEDCR